MKYTFVGDLHGQYGLAKSIIEQFEGDSRLVFVGDYVDSFVESLENQAKTFNLIFDGAMERRWDALLGNHDLHYSSDSMRGSGYNYKLLEICPKLRAINATSTWPFKELLIVGNILVTHAGLSKNFNGSLYGIGRCRGGFQDVGGIFWCDFNQEFQPIEGLRQVFGHTSQRQIEQDGDNYCIDCLERGKLEVLQYNTETDKLTVVPLSAAASPPKKIDNVPETE